MGGGAKNRFQYCVCAQMILKLLYLRALQGHSGGVQIDTSLQDLAVLPGDFAEYLYHVGNSHELHSITRSGLSADGRDAKKGRQTVFFTAVNPMEIREHWQTEFELTKPRITVNRQKWKVHKTHCILGQFESRPEEGIDIYTGLHQPRSFSTTLFLRFASKKWYFGRREKYYTIKCTIHFVHRQKSY